MLVESVIARFQIFVELKECIYLTNFKTRVSWYLCGNHGDSQGWALHQHHKTTTWPEWPLASAVQWKSNWHVLYSLESYKFTRESSLVSEHLNPFPKRLRAGTAKKKMSLECDLLSYYVLAIPVCAVLLCVDYSMKKQQSIHFTCHPPNQTNKRMQHVTTCPKILRWRLKPLQMWVWRVHGPNTSTCLMKSTSCLNTKNDRMFNLNTLWVYKNVCSM